MYIRNQNGVSRKRGLNDVHCKQDRTKQGISEKTALSPLFGAHMIYDHLSQCQPCQARRRVQ